MIIHSFLRLSLFVAVHFVKDLKAAEFEICLLARNWNEGSVILQTIDFPERFHVP